MVFIVLPLICTDLNANGRIIALRIWKCYESEYVLMRFSPKIHISFGFWGIEMWPGHPNMKL